MRSSVWLGSGVSRRKTSQSSFAFVALLTLASCLAEPRFIGPLPVRNQHPAQVTVMQMPPQTAKVLAAGESRARVNVAYSSLFLSAGDANRNFVMDGEYLRFGPTLRTGLGADLELAIGLPFAHTSGGFLDSFLIQYHDAFGFPDQNRDVTPKDNFSIGATQNGQSVWRVESSSFELLDVPLHLTWQVADVDDGLGVALRAGIELPTGNDERGYGNGQLDYSLGCLLEHHWRGVAFYGHAQHTFAGTPSVSRRAGFHFADVTSAGLGAELPLTDWMSGFLQLGFETSTLRDLGLTETSRKQLLLWAGARFMVTERSGIELAFGEDLIGFVSPDFTFWIGYTGVPW